MMQATLWFLVVSVSAVTVVHFDAQQPREQQVFRSSVRTVTAYATVTHEDGRLVPDLTREDFEIRDNGRPQSITVFENGKVPITAAVMLDTSGSTQPIISLLRDGAVRFARALLPGDRAVVGSFGFEIAVSPHLTGDAATLEAVLREELWPGGPTPLWNALYAAMDALAEEPGRRVILVFTDGSDYTAGFRTDRHRNPSEVLARARDHEFMVYAIRPAREDTFLARRADVHSRLLDIVKESGGGFLDVGPGENLGQAFEKVATELRHQYLLGFSPEALDGRNHRLQVRVRKPGMRVRARTSYLAVPE